MRERKFAPFVRLEVDCEMPSDMVDRLTEELQLVRDDVYRICGPMALGGEAPVVASLIASNLFISMCVFDFVFLLSNPRLNSFF
jgi:polyphosphate kinase